MQIFIGRILSEPNFRAAEGEKKAFVSFSLAINTRKEEDGTYKSDFMRCKAFGYAAERIAETWSKEEDVVLEGNIVMGNDYTNNEGEIVTGTWELLVNKKHEYNTLNMTSQGDRLIRGRIANFSNAMRYFAGSGEKKYLMYLTVGVSKGYKKEGSEYYEEQLIKLVLFGNAADAVNENYSNGDFITVQGRAQAGKDYEKDGEIVDGGEEILVNKLFGFAPAGKAASTGAKKSTGATAPKKAGAPSFAPAKAPGAAPKAPTAGGPKKLGGLKKLGK